MGLYALIAAEFHIYLPDSVPVYHLMHLAQVAEKRRNDRIEAAKDGKVYVG